jgi:hypothetical protein
MRCLTVWYRLLTIDSNKDEDTWWVIWRKKFLMINFWLNPLLLSSIREKKELMLLFDRAQTRNNHEIWWCRRCCYWWWFFLKENLSIYCYLRYNRKKTFSWYAFSFWEQLPGLFRTRYRVRNVFSTRFVLTRSKEFDSILNVAMSDEKDNVFKMILNVDMKIIMIKRFFWIDSTICFFAKNSIASRICFFVDANVLKLIVFFLISMTNETQ